MTNEAKVGAFTLAGLVVLAFILVHMSDFRLFTPKENTIYVNFNAVMGLNPSADVCVSGVRVGRVAAVETSGTNALVTILVSPDVKIPLGSRISITSSGVLAEKCIGITPAVDTGQYIKDGDHVYGVDEQTMDTMMESINKAVIQVQDLLAALNDIVGDPNLQKSLIATTVNLRDLTANVRDMTAAFNRMAVNNEAEVANMVHNLNIMSVGMANTANELARLTHDFSGDGKTAANMKLAIANLTDTTKRIDNMAKSLEGVVTDPQTSADLKATLHNVRQVTEKANSMLDGFKGAHMEAGLETMYSGKESDWQANFDMRLYPSEDQFLLLGFNDIGDRNRFNAQYGKKAGAITGRAGVVDSKVGVGLDADAGSRWRFSLDAYDLNNVALKARVRYRVSGKTYLFGQMNDLNHRDKRTAFVGIRQEF